MRTKAVLTATVFLAGAISAAQEPIKKLTYGGYAHDDAPSASPNYDPASDGTTPATTLAKPSWIPRPIVFGGPSLVGGGYQTLAGNFGAGFLLRSRKILGDFEAYYMNARKTDDGTLNNTKGHERFLRGGVFYSWRSGLYVGGGAQWSETATTNYTKKAWRPAFGFGGDRFSRDISFRWQALYILPGTDRRNAVQGPEIQFWLPSPASKKHLFWRQTLGVYEFHNTIDDLHNPVLMARLTRGVTSFLDFTFGWRF